MKKQTKQTNGNGNGNTYGNAPTGFYKTRETWLNAAVRELETKVFAPTFKAAKIESAQWNKPIRVTCGWPAFTRAGKKAIGQCWSEVCSADKSVEILVSPMIDNPTGAGTKADEKNPAQGVLDILAHELIHAYVGNGQGHGGAFKAVAVAIGLVGPMTATIPGEKLNETLNAISKKLGAYPHAKLDYDEIKRTRKRQTTRLIKVECPACGCIARMSRSAIDNHGLPTCACGTRWEEC